MKAIRVSDQTHMRFKIACALRGVPMNATADVALNVFVDAWDAEDAEQEARSERAQEHKRDGPSD